MSANLNVGDILLSRSLTDEEVIKAEFFVGRYGKSNYYYSDPKCGPFICLDEVYGDIESDLENLIAYLNSIGVSANGFIESYGVWEGRWVIDNGKTDWEEKVYLTDLSFEEIEARYKELYREKFGEWSI